MGDSAADDQLASERASEGMDGWMATSQGKVCLSDEGWLIEDGLKKKSNRQISAAREKEHPCSTRC